MKSRVSLEFIVLAITLVTVSALALADWPQGIAAFNTGDYQVAAEHFTEITRSNPSWPGGYYMLGRCHTEIGNRAEALVNLQKAFELDPSDTDTIIALGQALMNESKYPETRKLLRRGRHRSDVARIAFASGNLFGFGHARRGRSRGGRQSSPGAYRRGHRQFPHSSEHSGRPRRDPEIKKGPL